MSRAKIGAVVAVIVAALTALAFVLATRRLEAQIGRDVEERVARAEDLLTQIGAVEALNLITRAQELARMDPLLQALGQPTPAARKDLGTPALQRFVGALGAARPDFVALVDARGAVVAADAPLPDSDDLRSRFRSVAAALDSGQASKDVWDYGKGTVKVGVAPVLDPVTHERPGAVILGYAVSAKEAQEHARKLGSEVILFSGDRVLATSFARSVVTDLAAEPGLAALAAAAIAGKRTTPVVVTLGGETYVADGGLLPLNFDDRKTGALVLESMSRALEPLATVKLAILLLGLAGFVVALLAQYIASRAILHQADEIEAGVTEIINGDSEYSFRPVGSDLDGLANALNVMLARLLGRPDPGDEALDTGTTAIATGRVVLDEASGQARLASDPESVALAREPEADYLRRLHGEFLSARRAVLGDTAAPVSLESFAAKIRLSEASMKKKYACKAVRFRVTTNDGQVCLKPVPIVSP